MKRKEHKNIDPSLDTPSEANTQKHINFVEMEESNEEPDNDRKDDFTRERQKKWRQGIEEGKQERERSE